MVSPPLLSVASSRALQPFQGINLNQVHRWLQWLCRQQDCAKQCCYNPDTQTSVKGPGDVEFLFGFLRKAKDKWERGGWINAVRSNYSGRKDRNPVFLTGTHTAQQQNSRGGSTRQRPKLLVGTQLWKELTSIRMLQKIIFLNLLAQKKTGTTAIRKRMRGEAKQGQSTKVTGHFWRAGVVAEVHKTCMFKWKLSEREVQLLLQTKTSKHLLLNPPPPMKVNTRPQKLQDILGCKSRAFSLGHCSKQMMCWLLQV